MFVQELRQQLRPHCIDLSWQLQGGDKIVDQLITIQEHFLPALFLQKLAIDLPGGFDQFAVTRQNEVLVSRLLCRLQQLLYFPQDPQDSQDPEASETQRYKIESFYKTGEGQLAGSISHSKGLVRSAMVDRSNFKYIGVDSEQIQRQALKKDLLWEKITIENERQLLKDHGWEDMKYRTLVFSAKEALYKFAYPFYQKYFGFLEAEVIECTPDYVVLQSHVLKHLKKDRIKVYYKFLQEYVHTMTVGS